MLGNERHMAQTEAAAFQRPEKGIDGARLHEGMRVVHGLLRSLVVLGWGLQKGRKGGRGRGRGQARQDTCLILNLKSKKH